MLEVIKPTLNELYSNGLIDGAIGRGSYFDKNGYLSKDDDIDIVLLKNKENVDPTEWSNSNKKIRYTISSAKEDFTANFTESSDTTIKKAKSQNAPMFSFDLLPTSYKGIGIYYEKYVLNNCVGIEIDGISSLDSEKLAKSMLRNAPIDNREELIKEGKLSILPPNETDK